jgi:uncharacterized protein YeaO (DUF488 family)
MASGTDVRVRRVYEPASPGDGERILVDRLWPRGLSKDAAEVDDWLKDVAPSTELRRWYGHEPARFAEFRRRYAAELRDPQRAAALRRLGEAARRGTVTLLTAAKDAAHSQAALLAEQLRAAAVNRAEPGDARQAKGAGRAGQAEEPDVPGDPACWLPRVCPACGAIADASPPTTCPQCGGAISRA